MEVYVDVVCSRKVLSQSDYAEVVYRWRYT
jgi:hypothetical protein